LPNLIYKFPAFVEPNNLLPCSQVTEPDSEPHE
jgi:hypothetical protein